MSELEIGRLLRANITRCVLGCRVSHLDAPLFGGMVRIPLGIEEAAIGLIYDIHIDDDGLVRQLVTAEHISDEVIEDNRRNRNVPVEISALFIGRVHAGNMSHLLPQRPPLTLDKIYPCTAEEVCAFTGGGRLGYLRHILNDPTLPVGELLTAHLQQAGEAQRAAGNPAWLDDAVREVVILLRDDYERLMQVLSALGEVYQAGGAA